MAEIYFCNAEKFAPFYEKAILFLPKARKEKTERFLRQEDRILSLCAGLMVLNIFGKDAFDKMKYGEHEKPFFEHGPFFSISHSGKYAVLAVSDEEIGVDVEMRDEPKIAVSKRCFLDEEQEYANLSTENFLRIWTAKEAVLKLLGTGFSYSPKNFSVLPLSDEHSINGVNMRFFCTNIEEVPLTLAYCGDKKDFIIRELLPENLIN